MSQSLHVCLFHQVPLSEEGFTDDATAAAYKSSVQTCAQPDTHSHVGLSFSGWTRGIITHSGLIHGNLRAFYIVLTRR